MSSVTTVTYLKCLKEGPPPDRHPFNGLFSGQSGNAGTRRKVKPIWILMKQETTGWQLHQLDHMQIICTSLQTDNHASTSLLIFFTGRMLFLTPNQQRQSTEGRLTANVQASLMSIQCNGAVICLERGANDLPIVQLMPLPPDRLLLR